MARTRLLSGVVGVPVEGLLSVRRPELKVALFQTEEERVQLIMMHDYYWYEKNAGREPDWVVERVSPSRIGYHAIKSKAFKYYGYRLVGDFTIVWECCYDNMPELYDWSLTNAENVSKR